MNRLSGSSLSCSAETRSAASANPVELRAGAGLPSRAVFELCRMRASCVALEVSERVGVSEGERRGRTRGSRLTIRPVPLRLFLNAFSPYLAVRKGQQREGIRWERTKRTIFDDRMPIPSPPEVPVLLLVDRPIQHLLDHDVQHTTSRRVLLEFLLKLLASGSFGSGAKPDGERPGVGPLQEEFEDVAVRMLLLLEKEAVGGGVVCAGRRGRS